MSLNDLQKYHNKIGLIVEMLDESPSYTSFEVYENNEKLFKILPKDLKNEIYIRLSKVIGINQTDIDGLKDYVENHDAYFEESQKFLLSFVARSVSHYYENMGIDSRGFFSASGLFNLNKKRISRAEIFECVDKYIEVSDGLKAIKKMLDDHYSSLTKE